MKKEFLKLKTAAEWLREVEKKMQRRAKIMGEISAETAEWLGYDYTTDSVIYEKAPDEDEDAVRITCTAFIVDELRELRALLEQHYKTE